VRRPAHLSAAKDEAIGCELDEEPPDEFDEVSSEEARVQEDLPPAPPVHACRRPLQPHCVAIGDSERREECRERVADKGRVEVIQIARADNDEDGEDRRHHDPPNR
jgi:hypothetical protein